ISLLYIFFVLLFFFFSSRRRHTRFSRDWSSDVCSSDLVAIDHDGNVYATGLGNDRLAILNPDGSPRPGSPLDRDDLGLNKPMGKIGRASCRERVWISVVAGSLERKKDAMRSESD